MEKKLKYLIRVNYESGIQEEFWYKSFTIKGDTWEWEAVSPPKTKPILMNVDKVESVWQLDAIEVNPEATHRVTAEGIQLL